MPYVIVEGILGGGRKIEHEGSSEGRVVRNGNSSSPRQAVERNQTQQTKQLFYTAVSGLKANEIADLKNFSPGVDKDNYTITFPQHPCVILNALEVLGFDVISSSPKVIFNNYGQNINENIPEIKNHPEQSIVWTLKKEFER